MTEDKTTIRNAATVIVVRDRDHTPKVLMGQRGSKAAFMPNKFVFPGGAVDIQDGAIDLKASITEPCRSRLQKDADPTLCDALCVAAIRELFEETGHTIRRIPRPRHVADAQHVRLQFLALGILLQRCLSAEAGDLTDPGRHTRSAAQHAEHGHADVGGHGRGISLRRMSRRHMANLMGQNASHFRFVLC